MIVFENVEYGYKPGTKILDDVSFEIEDGSFTALTGPSGAGKSTILWHILGVLSPDTGQVRCLGAEPSKLGRRALAQYRRKIGFVPQDMLLLEDQTVLGNLVVVLSGIGLTHRNAVMRAHNVLDIVELRDREKDMPRELSGGERQRLAIARALSVTPRILLADEPTGNLDPERSREIMQLFRRIRDMDITVLISTHERELMRELGADTLYLENGKTELTKIGVE